MLGKGWFPAEIGGLDRYYRELLEELPEASGVVVGPGDDALPPRVRAVSHHDAPLAARLLAFNRASRQIGRHAEVVDAHFALYAAFPVLIGALRGRTFIVHFQGPWASENVAAGDSSRARRWARERLERAVYARAAVVVTLSGAFRQLLLERYALNPWSAVVLTPGVDLVRFDHQEQGVARAQFGLSPTAFVVCCVRRLVPRMGLSILLEAWAKHLESTTGESVLLIAGDGELRAQLEAQIDRLGIAGTVTMLGRVSDEKLATLYQAVDVNVLPSLSFEGFGLVVLEAAACGTPSIVTRVGGLPEAVGGLGSRLVVAPADVGALAARLEAAKRGDLPSRAATRSWSEQHGWGRVASAHRALTRRLLRGERADARLRVVYLDHVAQLSGAEIALVRLIGAMESVRAHVILGQSGPLVERLVEAGASVEILPMHESARGVRRADARLGRVSVRGIYETAIYVIRLARRLRTLQPDVVHTNSLKAGVYGAVAARLAGRRVVWHVRDSIDTGYLPGPAVQAIRRLVRRLPHAVIANSHGTLATLGSLRVPHAVVAEIVAAPCGARGSVPGHAEPPLAFGIVGRLSRWKGQHVFLRAFARAYPQGPARAVIVGSPMFGADDEAYAAELYALARCLGISDRVDFRGFRENVWEELAQFDVLVHASTIAEPFGQVVVEGMAMGLPVVATLGGGPSEIVTDGVNGLLYPPGDVAALAEILRRLGSDPGMRKRLASAAKLRAGDYAPAAIVEQIGAIYHAVTNQSGRTVVTAFGPERPVS